MCRSPCIKRQAPIAIGRREILQLFDHLVGGDFPASNLRRHAMRSYASRPMRPRGAPCSLCGGNDHRPGACTGGSRGCLASGPESKEESDASQTQVGGDPRDCRAGAHCWACRQAAAQAPGSTRLQNVIQMTGRCTTARRFLALQPTRPDQQDERKGSRCGVGATRPEPSYKAWSPRRSSSTVFSTTSAPQPCLRPRRCDR